MGSCGPEIRRKRLNKVFPAFQGEGGMLGRLQGAFDRSEEAYPFVRFATHGKGGRKKEGEPRWAFQDKTLVMSAQHDGEKRLLLNCS